MTRKSDSESINSSASGEENNPETDFSYKMSYGDYLGLDKVLDAQHQLSDTHDEMLFIIQHQTSELWMKLAIHEINSARDAIREDQYRRAFKNLSRVSKIFEQLNSAWDVLRTMTPIEYTSFRDDLAQSSGFQSHQYRLIEYMVGNRNKAMLKPHAHRPDIIELLQAELLIPSLYDEVILSLNRSGFSVLPTQNKISSTYKYNNELEAAWKTIYESSDKYWNLYELAEKLVDFEDYFRRWRFNHVTTVERVIGFKRGTGGTGGVQYLKKMLEVELFPELWRVRTVL